MVEGLGFKGLGCRSLRVQVSKNSGYAVWVPHIDGVKPE